ncbi:MULTISPECIES: hypothetical protein [Rodentibacter]|uniref:hypothetical protein n=1 Tax=Rodentibacter TaxID=1960084 RepID=UPI001CFE4B29|nr:hypothetical protein [Rodentibacter sp. JRC1]GJI55570.1 hypothetical protein HEMROJRC1_06820 [Rodentibacter sp. JRC1]
MKEFLIFPNNYLSRIIQGYFREFYYHKGDSRGTLEYLLSLKNDFNNIPISQLHKACTELKEGLKDEIIEIASKIEQEGDIAICVVPRSKAKNTYSNQQQLFSSSINDVVNELANPITKVVNGVHWITRHTDTRTTHLNKSGYGGKGDMPYVGITKDTCYIDNEVFGKNIILIDDIYTKTANIDEDCIQALLDKGAKTVVFFAIGKTWHSSDGITTSSKQTSNELNWNNYATEEDIDNLI